MSAALPAHVTARLTIDLDGIASNYRQLRQRANGAETCAVVKANAYGLGVAPVARTLAAAKCRTFFVATIDEGLALRRVLPSESGCAIHVLMGVLPDTAPLLTANALVPVLNSLAQLDLWRTWCHQQQRALPADLHVDTGMNRLGLDADEVAQLAAQPERLEGVKREFLMSHLACADQPDHPLNAQQLAAFQALPATLRAGWQPCFANSSGIFLGAAYHAAAVRPGCALYGINPTPKAANPMAQVVALEARILQVRHVDSPQSVGYGASYRVPENKRIATVAVGYADGYLRSLSNQGSVFVADVAAPIVGRVSMDLITVDVSAVPDSQLHPGAWAQLIGPGNPVDLVAENAGTIGYEILTSLGERYHRSYQGDVARHGD